MGFSRIEESGRQPVEHRQPRRNGGPLRAATRKDCDLRLEQRGIIERASVDRVRIIFADNSSEDEATANSAMVTDRIGAARGLRDRQSRLATEAHRIRRKTHEGNEAGTGGLAAIAAVTMSGHAG